MLKGSLNNLNTLASLCCGVANSNCLSFRNQVALKGLTYDPKSDVLEVVTEALDHMIQHPSEIYVEESGDGLVTVEALDSDGNKQIIKLTSPLLIASDAA